jgi:hypothetical protein
VDLIKKDIFNLSIQYQTMFDQIIKDFPVIEKATGNFHKTQSQFMDAIMTVSQPTKIRSARQCLAEIESAKQALVETHFGIKKKEIEIKKKKKELENSDLEELDRQLLEIELQEYVAKDLGLKGYVEGAIRRVITFMSLYKDIMNSLNINEMTEEDFEKDEERYHIMTAFTQGLCAARAHGGAIDEGNQIYFHQIGINGTQAQIEMNKYLSSELELANKGIDIPHEMTTKWLDEMANKFHNCSINYSKSKNMTLINKAAMHSLSEG